MALGTKTTTAKQVGDILWSDGAFTVYSDASLSQKSFTSYSGQELGVITEITSSYIATDFSDPYEGVVPKYFKPSSNYHPMANPDYNYQPVTVATDGTQTSKTGGFWSILGNLFGFGTEILKKTNGTTTPATTKTTTTNGGTDTTVVDPNAAGNSSSSTTYLFIGAGVLLLILLVVIFWKPKSNTPAPQTTDSPQVVKLS